MNKNRLAELLRQISLVRSAKIAAPLKRSGDTLVPIGGSSAEKFRGRRSVVHADRSVRVPFVQHLDGVIVMQPRKRSLDLFELRDVALKSIQLRSSISEDTVSDG